MFVSITGDFQAWILLVICLPEETDFLFSGVDVVFGHLGLTMFRGSADLALPICVSRGSEAISILGAGRDKFPALEFAQTSLSFGLRAECR